MELLHGQPPESRPPAECLGAPGWRRLAAPPEPAPAVAGFGDDPAAVRTAASVAQALLEVAAGLRGIDQVGPLLGPRAVTAVRDWAPRWAAPQRSGPPRSAPTRIRRIRAATPRPDVIEAAVVYTDGLATSVFAMRLERLRGRWHCVVLERPPHEAATRRIAS